MPRHRRSEWAAEFRTYHRLPAADWSAENARNSMVLLMVLFENVHVFNSRSELRPAFAHDPHRNLLLADGTVLAQLLHVPAMHLPFTRAVLGLHRCPSRTGRYCSRSR